LISSTVTCPRPCDTLLQNHGVGTGGNVLDAFPDDGLGQQGGGGGAVSGHIVGLGGNFLNQLGTQVFKWVFQFNFPGDGDTVIGDHGGAELLVQHYVSTFGPEGYLYCIGQFVHTLFQGRDGLLP
jgi:hypothetical protein